MENGCNCNDNCKTVLFTLAVDNYAPDMQKLTLPLMAYYADKIGATFVVINKRRWPDLPPVMEKFQIYYLAQEEFKDYDWFMFYDLDTLIHPEMFNPTTFLSKDTTCSGIVSDFTPNRFRPNAYFLRDGRFIGKGNWCAIFSNWCLDYYHPPEIMTKEYIEEIAKHNIRLTLMEQRSGVMRPDHLIDDYIVSRNIARYGLKHTLVEKIGENLGRPAAPYLWHQYLHDREKKVLLMQKQLEPPSQANPGAWGIDVRGMGVIDLNLNTVSEEPGECKETTTCAL